MALKNVGSASHTSEDISAGVSIQDSITLGMGKGVLFGGVLIFNIILNANISEINRFTPGSLSSELSPRLCSVPSSRSSNSESDPVPGSTSFLKVRSFPN
jgi:hypothetical protein